VLRVYKKALAFAKGSFIWSGSTAVARQPCAERKILNNMKTWRENLVTRARQTNAAGEYVSFIDGNETVEQLRELVMHLTLHCPLGLHQSGCPFSILSGISYESLKQAIGKMSREDCIDLFEMERAVRAVGFSSRSHGHEAAVS
jgi:hypothetical protein